MFKKKVKMLFSIGMLLCSLSNFAQEIKEPKEVEKIIDRVLEKSYHASVKIYSYDTVYKRIVPGVFSGVVVSKDGYILTVAHTTKVGQIYKVVFPNEDSYIAKALGRIAIEKVPENDRRLDIAMLKIIEQGNWSFVNMGQSENMKVGELCVGISSPGLFSKKQPSIRLGRLTNVNYSSGMFESTCKMEPGDSGGALFNSDGDLIGIHSQIETSEEQNFEIPVDLYKKFWSALLQPKDYKSLPDSVPLASVKPSSTLVTIPPIQQLVNLPKKITSCSVAIHSLIDDKKMNILGTVITNEKLSKRNTYIISKSSMVGDNVKVTINGVERNANVMAREIKNDLVLLEINLPSPKNSIKIDSKADTLAINFADLGNLLVSALANNKQYVSVISDKFSNMPQLKGSFGANATFINNKITITQITKKGSADGIIKLNDVIIAVNGIAISQPEHYGLELSKYFVGDTVKITLIRDEKQMEVKVCYLPRVSNHIAEEFENGKSVRTDNFKKVLIHDAAVKASECGSPVFNKEGKFYGINIARVSRTATIMLPYDAIRSFLNGIVLN